jgi:hypothetical protein
MQLTLVIFREIDTLPISCVDGFTHLILHMRVCDLERPCCSFLLLGRWCGQLLFRYRVRAQFLCLSALSQMKYSRPARSLEISSVSPILTLSHSVIMSKHQSRWCCLLTLRLTFPSSTPLFKVVPPYSLPSFVTSFSDADSEGVLLTQSR